MINKNSSLVFYKAMFATLIMSCTFIFAQNHENTSVTRTEETVTTAYNVPFTYSFDPSTDWEIKNSNGELVSSGSGNLTQVFNKPGNYFLNITEKHKHDSNTSCEHAQYPSKVTIKVSSAKMVFDFSTIHFSKKIENSQSVKDIVLKIDATYQSFDNPTAVYHYGFTTAGVGTSLKGKLKGGKVLLKNGINTLEFLLEGNFTKDNNIMIDFKDINEQVQSYTLIGKNN